MIKFALQILNPIVVGNQDSDPSDETLREAIETIYSDERRDLVMIWNNYPIKMSIKYDISDCWLDIMTMLQIIRTKELNELVINWPSCTFFAQWHLIIKEDILIIEAIWMSIAGGEEQIAKVPNKIKVDKSYFVNQWHQLLNIIKDDLFKAGFSSQNLTDFNDLLTELNSYQ